MYGQSFFDLQLQFARKVSAVSGLPFADALLRYTNLYVRFGLGRDFDPDHPAWRQYVAGLPGAADTAEWTYRFYLTRPETEPPGIVATCGCFSYARLGKDRVRLTSGTRRATGAPRSGALGGVTASRTWLPSSRICDARWMGP